MAIRSNFIRHWGVFKGEFQLDDGTTITVDSIPGFLEFNKSRW